VLCISLTSRYLPIPFTWSKQIMIISSCTALGIWPCPSCNTWWRVWLQAYSLQHLYYILVCDAAVGCASLLCLLPHIRMASEHYIHVFGWVSTSSIWVQVGDLCQWIGASLVWCKREKFINHKSSTFGSFITSKLLVLLLCGLVGQKRNVCHRPPHGNKNK